MLERLFSNNQDYFESILSAISQAQFQIDLEVYIYESGFIGEQIQNALIEAARRGVRVRVLVDGAGVSYDFTTIATTLQNAGVYVRIYRPLPWRLEQWKYSLVSLKGFLKFWRLLSDINHRNHRKMLIIDRHHCWLGSMNISQAQLSPSEGGKAWRDTAVQVSQADLSPAIKAFELVWNRSTRKLRSAAARQQLHSAFRFNFHLSLRHLHHRQLLQKIRRAKTRIWITNAYFAPSQLLLIALENAAKRGVEVRILLPKKSDIFFMPWISAYYYLRLLRASAHVYEYLPSVLHAKTLVIDDWATVGSTNLNNRSLRHDLEVDYVLQNKDNVKALCQIFEEDVRESQKITAELLKSSKRWQRLLGAILLILIGHWI